MPFTPSPASSSRRLTPLTCAALVCLLAGCGSAGRADGGTGLCPAGTFAAAGQCTPWTTCAAGQYQTATGSSTRDRTCAGCASGTFSSAVNAASCTAWTTCVAGEHVATAGSDSRDQWCSPCANGSFSTGVNQVTCVVAGACSPGTVERTAATATSPAACTTCSQGTWCEGGTAAAVPCAAGTWDHDGDPATACAPQTTCLAGESATAGSALVDRSCSPCANGTYTATTNVAACLPWSDCGPGTWAADGTAAMNRRCTACSNGYSTTVNALVCTAWRTCGAGSSVTMAGTTMTDRTCGACTAGTWSAGPNTATCAAWSTCGAGQFLATEGTASANRVCATCTSGYSTTTNAAACTPWTSCGPGRYASPAGTSTTDAVCNNCPSGTFTSASNAVACASWSICRAGQYVSSAGTQIADQGCTACPSGQTTTTQNAASCIPGSFVSGTVAGLAGSGLVLQDNLGDDLAISSNGTFIFPTTLSTGSPYAVTVLTQPVPAVGPCTIANGSGTISGNVTNVAISCGTVFRVTSEGRLPVAGARAVLVGPTTTVQAVADGAGVINVSFPATERPFTMTVAATGHEALSVIGLNEIPDEVFIAPTTNSGATGTLMGAISGRASTADFVNVDLLEGNTVYSSSPSYSTPYALASLYPVQVVAIELSAAGLPINWTTSPPLARTAGTQSFDVLFPSDAGAFLGTNINVVPASTGLFTASAVSLMARQGMAAHYVGNTGSALDGGFAYVMSGWLQFPADGGVEARGIDSPLLPNRALVSLDGPGGSLRFWVRDPFASSSNVVTAPSVTGVASAGTALNNASALAVATGFDALEFQISGGPSGNTAMTYWRIYTAPGAPFSIMHLPQLPSGITPLNLGIAPTATVYGMPMLLRFADPASRPWQLPGGNWSVPAFEATAAGTSRLLNSTWP